MNISLIDARANKPQPICECYDPSMKSMDRFVNFSDAVMAIAVTLLILPLTERASGLRVNSYHAFASAYGHLIFIFLLSFVVICRYWEVHHNLLNSIQTFNGAMFWLNAFWLLSIVFIPFTSELIGNDSTNSVFINAVYIGSLTLTAYIGFGIQWLTVHSPALQKPSSVSSRSASYGLVSAAVMSAALVLAVLVPSLGVWPLLLLVPASYVARSLRQKPKVRRSN